MVLKLGVLGGNVPKCIGHLLTNPLSGGTSESLGTLFHKCMTRNPTDVTLIMDSLHDSIKGVLQYARDLRTEKESMTQRESMSMLSREEKKQRPNAPNKCSPSQFTRKRVRRREIKSIGVGVTAEEQKIFDAFSKTIALGLQRLLSDYAFAAVKMPATYVVYTELFFVFQLRTARGRWLLPVHWVNKDILVSGEVRICSPYHDDCVTGGTATARDQIKAVLKQVRQELQLGTGGN
ncbi:hypothetical protein DY000_02044198 [Brassica cretica]|uniref:AD domain-containing protein n=1 Tax=Brassica cretica TaxID=69181 RepID=A0ABQ7F427_BRACR|nr:hypothetical protein DY000_02044198 [Brassica cretica]